MMPHDSFPTLLHGSILFMAPQTTLQGLLFSLRPVAAQTKPR